ncbi:selenide, water dikinase SelD [Shimia sp. MMG029]|uniref:selenide, water dikinase SelD n=1 Tax=Shimia sp. MMG029 TaxID=3021978 RepID=UPI0022FE016E|nr:selenide, water dikinase SelD [Shimia sp. MMG029]MDA5555741.1 selenide, water dikinase SelD [Shimia sp. MMG029]
MTADRMLTRDLVLVGGGHAHALMLRMWGMAPVAGVRVTLINPGPTAPYSGMLPGHIAGHYSREALDIDLVRLAQWAGVRLINGAATAIDPVARVVTVEDAILGAREIAYDVASLDVGLHAVTSHIAGFAKYGVGAKPLGVYADRWAGFLKQVEMGQAEGQVAVIGGGVAGSELAMAMAHKLRSMGKRDGVTLIETSAALGNGVPGADRALRAEMAELGVRVRLNAKVSQVRAHAVALKGAVEVASEFTVATAGGFAHSWLAASGLPCDDDGFVHVDDRLVVEGHEGLFAVGDCAHLLASPRPKAGVFAVRAAPVLLANIRAALTGSAYESFRPQGDYLKLISLGGKEAMAAKWGRVLRGPAVMLWRMKDGIDQKFMRQFEDLPQMAKPEAAEWVADGGPTQDDDQMLCGGCGAKVAPGQLATALDALPDRRRTDVLSGPGDDAAVLEIGGVRQVISVDHLRGFVTDPAVMARIAAVHALGDVWAMGAAAQSALLSVTLPRMTPALQARAMTEILQATSDVVQGAGAEIVGGHSTMGAELSLGLTVTGLAEGAPITVAGAQEGDRLILTRPIGSGTILAAMMQGKARGADVAALLSQMAQPQGDAAAILRGAHAMTDVTGFGLAGHLMAICRASDVAAALDLAAVPFYAGAEALAEAGHRSTIYADNAAHAPVFGPESARAALLHDPQTAGGLLAAVQPEEAAGLVVQLRALGHAAAVIGTVQKGAPSISLI